MASMAKHMDEVPASREQAASALDRKFWRFAPLISRLILLWPSIILAVIGIRGVFDPAGFGAAQGIGFKTSEAVAIGRVGLGAFPLGCAVFAWWCLGSSGRVVTGLTFVAILMSVAIAARIVAIDLDHAMGRNLNLLEVEAVILVVCVLGIFIERKVTLTNMS
jgi:hypothetical protein